ncbi:MAG TPA: DNA translocase FtsK [Candidatus Limnocylindrales bacterium]
MATRRRSSPGRPAARRRRTFRWPSIRITPDAMRTLAGLTLLVLGAVTLIALLLQGQGTLTTWWIGTVGPWFGSVRWLLPFLLLAAGWHVELGPGRRPNSGWGLTLLGIAVAYAGVLGVVEAIGPFSGGRIGRFLVSVLVPLVTEPGAIVLLAAAAVGGILLAFNLQLHQLLRPVSGSARWLGSTAAASMRRDAAGGGGARGADARTNGDADRRGRGRARPVPNVASPGQAGIWGGDPEGNGRHPIPVPSPNPAPLSSTFAPAPTLTPSPGPGVQASPSPVAIDERAERDPDDVTDASDSPPTREPRPYRLPPVTLLDDIVARAPDDGMDHELNSRIIEAKLASFNIPARVLRWNAGPVVTQYEVEPDASVKVSRIEGLADDLAMALAARTIRIEAPIPGKSVVGIEIPNADFNVVGLRTILEDASYRELAASSKLAFALGRDVAGHARGTDLARMPHVLIAGATGSGKSVMVNALITSLLCNATPDDVRLILLDLKRVELAAYNGLPHLMVPVITEPERAKAALKWAVGEMESRYRRFAGATARNISGYNATRVDPADRLPFIVIIVDELADLMMREGKNVEDPVVRLAQKARATGIHLVLATQRPSVNVVTGLIKANFPSRIAFAMASQIDSRTILDAPGAEDLIGRGDMLFQPADQPKPMRLQGVFVSDREIANVTQHCRAEAEAHYDLAIVETDEDGTGAVDDLADEDADRLLPDAVAVIQEYDRASASLLQRRLKVGYARAARIIDQLEERGYIGPFDGSNARQVLRRDAGAATRAGDGEDDYDA